MLRLGRGVAFAVACLVLASAAPAQEREGIGGVTHVLGLEGVKRNTKGTVFVDDAAVRFMAGSSRAEIPLEQIQDVFTGDDSQRVVGGTLQTLSMFAPYAGGRFLSLFRHKIDLLTIEYRDANGALHGVVMTLPDGKAAVVKKQMVERGARASVPPSAETPKDDKKKEEKKP
jgi:hypothetical protein